MLTEAVSTVNYQLFMVHLAPSGSQEGVCFQGRLMHLESRKWEHHPSLVRADHVSHTFSLNSDISKQAHISCNLCLNPSKQPLPASSCTSTLALPATLNRGHLNPHLALSGTKPKHLLQATSSVLASHQAGDKQGAHDGQAGRRNRKRNEQEGVELLWKPQPCLHPVHELQSNTTGWVMRLAVSI